MFKTLQSTNNKNLNHSGKSLVGETLQIEGNIKSSGSIEVAGLINGNAFVDDVTITETGSIRGTIEAKTLEVNGHIEGKVIADTIIINKNAIIKGDIFFKHSLRTEEGADIDGYIKRTHSGKSNFEEEIDIEEITQRPEVKERPKVAAAPAEEAI